MVWQALSSRRVLSDVVTATVLAAVILAGNAVVAWSYFDDGSRAQLKALSDSRSGLLASEREAYRWISDSTPPNARIVAYQDAQLYLYTDRQSMRPIVFTAAEFLDSKRLPGEIEHITDVAHAISAEYWLVSDDDFSAEWDGGRKAADRRMSGIEQVLPVVFRSSDGRVSVYGLSCVESAPDACVSPDAVLLPASPHVRSLTSPSAYVTPWISVGRPPVHER